MNVKAVSLTFYTREVALADHLAYRGNTSIEQGVDVLFGYLGER